MNKNNIYVGKLGKTVGLKGYLKLFIDSDFPEQFKKGANFYTNRKLVLTINDFTLSNNLVKFENYENVDLAKKLINQELYVTQEQTKENCILANNEYFWFELISCEVIENNLNLGKVIELLRYPKSDYLLIQTNEELVKNKQLPKEFLLPYIHDDFILEVDIDKKIIEVQKAYEILENS